jgi:hypothetical protein
MNIDLLLKCKQALADDVIYSGFMPVDEVFFRSPRQAFH